MATFNQQGQNIVGGTQINVGSSVWHDGTEAPSFLSDLIVDVGFIQNTTRFKVCWYEQNSFFSTTDGNSVQDIKRWMYIPD